MSQSNATIRTASSTELPEILKLASNSGMGVQSDNTTLGRELTFNVSRGLCLVAQNGEAIQGVLALREKFFEATRITCIAALNDDEEILNSLLEGAKSLADGKEIFIPTPAEGSALQKSLHNAGFSEAGSVILGGKSVSLLSCG